jgi:hypothetical protein
VMLPANEVAAPKYGFAAFIMLPADEEP